MSEFEIEEEGNIIMENNLGTYRAVQFYFHKNHTANWKEVIKTLWGFDIWFGDFPMLKLIILANIIVWLLLFGGA